MQRPRKTAARTHLISDLFKIFGRHLAGEATREAEHLKGNCQLPSGQLFQKCGWWRPKMISSRISRSFEGETNWSTSALFAIAIHRACSGRLRASAAKLARSAWRARWQQTTDDDRRPTFDLTLRTTTYYRRTDGRTTPSTTTVRPARLCCMSFLPSTTASIARVSRTQCYTHAHAFVEFQRMV